jgi:hypothetical protein
MERVFERQQSQIETITMAARATMEIQGGLSRAAAQRAFRRFESAQRLIETLAEYGAMSRAEQKACETIVKGCVKRMLHIVGDTHSALLREMVRPSSD